MISNTELRDMEKLADMIAGAGDVKPLPPCEHEWVAVPAKYFEKRAPSTREEYAYGAKTCLKCCAMEAATPGSLKGLTTYLDAEAREEGFRNERHRRAAIGEGVKLGGRWSRNESRCLDCGTNDLPHRGYGRCVNCYPVYRARMRKMGIIK